MGEVRRIVLLDATCVLPPIVYTGAKPSCTGACVSAALCSADVQSPSDVLASALFIPRQTILGCEGTVLRVSG